jgi:hypothetical protein
MVRCRWRLPAEGACFSFSGAFKTYANPRGSADPGDSHAIINRVGEGHGQSAARCGWSGPSLSKLHEPQIFPTCSLPHLLGRYCATWATPSVLLVIFPMVSHTFWSRLTLDLNLPTYFCVAGATGAYHRAQLVGWDGVSNFLPGLASNSDLPDLCLQVAANTGTTTLSP